MSRRTDGRGPNLADALRSALADLLDTDTDEVTLRIDAPGVDALSGRVSFDLEVVADEVEVAPSSRTEAASPEEPEVDEPRAHEGRGERSRGGAADEDEAAERTVTIEDLEEEADAAADFLEGLLDALDLPGDIRIRTTEDHAEVEVVEIGSGALIGRRGQTLEAIQELVRCALQREFQRRSRVKVDAEGYRARRLEKLIEKAEEAIDEVLDTGEPVRLEPMDVFERKSVHQIVADVDGVFSRSQGREPARRVVIERD
jgi:spoIIIJ-associated protein